MRLLAGMLFAVLALSARADGYSNVIFFGDSLTDTGNVATLYSTLPHPPGAPAAVPGAPYDAGGRFSNGLVYADVLAAGLGHDAVASQLGGDNYAFGGARTRYQSSGPPFLGVIDQINRYRALPGMADPGALHVVWAGANNLQDILLGRTVDVLGNPVPTLAQSVADIGAMLDGLYLEGARHLLVPNAPNLGRVPRITAFGPAAAASAALVSQVFNAQLSATLDAFEASHAGVHLIRFDAFASFEAIFANAAGHGLTNLTDRCYTGDDINFTGGGTVCANPGQYVFWDGIHPTTAVHDILGRAMLAAAIPEPGVPALMLFGLAALVAAIRRRAGATTPPG